MQWAQPATGAWWNDVAWWKKRVTDDLGLADTSRPITPVDERSQRPSSEDTDERQRANDQLPRHQAPWTAALTQDRSLSRA